MFLYFYKKKLAVNKYFGIKREKVAKKKLNNK